MKTFEIGERWVSKCEANSIAAHELSGYLTVLYADGIRTVEIEDAAQTVRVCKFKGYSGWYVGRWVSDSDPDAIDILSGPYPKLAPALVALKLEVTNG